MKTTALTLVALVATMASSFCAAAERKPQDIRVGILMFDGVQIIDFAAPYEVFGQAGYTIKTVSVDGKPVTTTMGLHVTPDTSLADAPRFDIVLVPGGHVADIVEDKPTQQWLKARASQADITLSVCTGSSILAASGLLDHLSATTFHTNFDGLAARAPTTKVVRDARWVDNGKIITSAGLSSGIDAALHVVERVSGLDRARTVAMHLEYDWDRDQGFVRGVMADRYIERVPMHWPEGSHFDRMLGYGDENQWTERIRVAATAPAERYLEAIATVYKGRGWTSQKSSDQQLVLRRKSEQGGDVTLRVAVQPRPEPQTFDLGVNIEVSK